MSESVTQFLVVAKLTGQIRLCASRVDRTAYPVPALPGSGGVASGADGPPPRVGEVPPNGVDGQMRAPARGALFGGGGPHGASAAGWEPRR